MPDEQHSSPASRIRPLALLSLILMLAAILRFYHIGDASFWLDEFLTVEISNGHGFDQLDLPREGFVPAVPDYVSIPHASPWHRIWTNSSRDVHPPLFYIVMRLWRDVFPDTDSGIRALSAVLSLGAVVLLYAAVNTQAGPVPALWASLLMAVAGVQIEYAQEARSYTMLEFSLLGGCVALLRIERYEFNWRRGTALGLCALVAGLTHYLAMPLLGALGLYASIQLRGPTRNRTIFAMVAAGLVYTAIWGPFAWVQHEGFGERIGFTKAENWSPGEWFYHLTALPLRYLATAHSKSRLVAELGGAIFLVPLFLMWQRPQLFFWWLWLFAGIGAVAAGDWCRHSELLSYIRYTFAVSPALYAIVAIMLSHLPGWTKHAVPLILSLACFAAIEGAYNRFTKPEWRDLGDYLTQNVGHGDVLVLVDDDPTLWLIRCDLVGMEYYARNLPLSVAFCSGPPSPDLLKQIATAPHIWMFAASLELPTETFFPGCTVIRHAFFPAIGFLAQVELAPGSTTNPSTTAPSLGPATLP